MNFPHFYPIVDSYAWIERIVPLGLKIVQLRIKTGTIDEIYRQVLQSKILCQRYNCQLIVNDYWELAIELQIAGVHLGFEDSQQADFTRIKSSKLIIGLSTHCLQELNFALQIAPSYIALGPIFPTTLKKMKFAPQGIERLNQWRNLMPAHIHLVAIGGISLERTEQIYAAGAQSIAVVSDITANIDPHGRVKKWLFYSS